MSFKAVAARIAQKENIPKNNADAILAAQTRKASPAARKANPALNKVKGKPNNKDIAARMLAARRKGKGKPPLVRDSDSDYA